MSQGIFSTKEVVCDDEESRTGTKEDVWPLNEEVEQTDVEIVISPETEEPLENVLKVEPDNAFAPTIDGNLLVLKQHAENSQTRFILPADIRLLLERSTTTFLDILYKTDGVKFIIFPYIVDNTSSQVFIFERKAKRSYHVMPGGKFHIFSTEDESLIGRHIIERIEEQNYQSVHHKIRSIPKAYRALFYLELTEELFARAEMEENLDGKFGKLFKALRKKVALPLTKKYREWNAEQVPEEKEIIGRVEKFIFCALVLVANGVVANLLYNMSSVFFSWFFFTFVCVSLTPKVYGSFRYMTAENKKEKKGFYNDDFIDPDINYDDDDREWKDVEVEVFRDPNWILRGDKSPIFTAANTPMYDETPDELDRTITSYINLVREYPTVEPSFIIDKYHETYKNVMKLMFDNEHLRERNGIYYVVDGHTRMKRLKNMQILYHGYWRGMKNRSFNVIFKPKGGGKRSSQLLFVRLIHLGIITKPRDSILYVDADTSFRPVDYGRLYNGLMRDPKAGAACGEVKVRNKSFKNLFTLAQAYEYLVNHMLAKAAESYFGIVLCCPGAWCMYRVESVEALLPKYCTKPRSMREFHRLEQGEDRYQNSLCLSNGWRAILIKSSKAKTQVPHFLKRLTEQRRRWNNSTLENNFVVLTIDKLWKRAPFYMGALAMDTIGFYLSPSIFLTLFGNSLGAFIDVRALVIILYSIIVMWILLQFIAVTIFYGVCVMLGAFLMVFVGIVATIQVFRVVAQQAPLISGLSVYAVIMATTAWRYGGWPSVILVMIGGLSYVLLLPLFFITFLLYSVTRYDTTSWR